jgi:glycosyltransferase involved in cell wall biosynthesis
VRILYLSGLIDTPTRLLIEHTARRPGVSAAVLSDCEASRRRMTPRVECAELRSRGKIDFAAMRELRRRIVAGRFDVVHAMSSRFLANALLATQRMPNAPAICAFMGHVGKFSRWNLIHRLTFLHPRVAAIWCNCHAVIEPLVRAGVTRSKCTTVYSGLPWNDRPPGPDDAIRRELGLPADAVVVGFAGNMRPVKGVDILLRAALLLKDEPKIRWLLLGHVKDQGVVRLLDHPDLRGRVHALGWRDDAERLLEAMDIFAMPSRSEGFSRAITEAMERGLCPVATRVGGTPELIRDGVEGLLTPPEDAAALAAAIRRLAHDAALRSRLAAAARQRIRSDLTIESMVDPMMAMYDAALANLRPSHFQRRAA